MGKFPHIADFILNPSPTVIEQFPTKNWESTNGVILSSPEKILQKGGAALAFYYFLSLRIVIQKDFDNPPKYYSL